MKRVFRATAALLSLLLLLLSFTSCGAARPVHASPVASRVVAKVGDVEIRYEELYFVTMRYIDELKRPYGENALVSSETVTLKKSEWTLALENGDPVVSLHIPGEGRLDPELVDETLADTKKFIADYLPDFKYKAFYCHSWLLDPQLEELVGSESNIVKFGKRFIRQTGKSGGGAIFSFVFLNPGAKNDLDSLPENTRLTKALKYHYLDGKRIYEVFGYFFD